MPRLAERIGAPSIEKSVGPLIDGVLSGSSSDAQIDVINPSIGQRCLSIPAGSVNDVDRAVASARQAFDDGRWGEAPPSFRKRVLHRLADLIAREASALDGLDAEEMGKPVTVARANAAAAADVMRFNAEAVDKVTGDVFTSDKNSLVGQRRVPRGVVAAVVPWNFPACNAVIKIAPALAAGNCVVLKPSELSSRSAVRLAQLAVEAGLPPGVLNVVLGFGDVVGRALALHMDVDMLTFTGSTAVGKLMLQYAGESNMKSVVAECGGKSPHIVFADGVDLDAAAQTIAGTILTNQGQICSAGSRVLVQNAVESELVEKIASRFERIVMGDARNPETTYGPLASSKQCTRVMGYIETGKAEGAELVIGGRRVMEETGGYFVEPTLFRNVLTTAAIAQEEIFGPVLSVIPFEDKAEAIRHANNTRFGLAAYVWTSSLSTGMRVAKAIRSMVLINSTAPGGEAAGCASSYEPVAQSGIGVEGGLAGVESYLRRQTIWINHA